MNQLNLNIEISGDFDNDLEVALREVARLVSEGYTSGEGSNESGDYRFSITKVR